jgi:intracellular sulfur oxidation DsrE/DsrF family protein
LIQSLKNTGVDFRVCDQALPGKKIDPKSVLPEIQVDQWALTTMMNLQTRGTCGLAASGLPEPLE